MFCGSRRSKSRLAEAAGAEPSGQMRDEKLHAVVARSTCRSQNAHKGPHVRSIFEVEKVHAVWRKAHFKVKSVKKRTVLWKLSC